VKRQKKREIKNKESEFTKEKKKKSIYETMHIIFINEEKNPINLYMI